MDDEVPSLRPQGQRERAKYAAHRALHDLEHYLENEKEQKDKDEDNKDDKKNNVSIAKDGIHIAEWDVSRVEDMEDMFYGASQFNADLSKWDTSRVTTMYKMFSNAVCESEKRVRP